MRIVHRQPEDEMPKCEFIFELTLSSILVITSENIVRCFPVLTTGDKWNNHGGK
jgi:hypothetical protein